MLAGARRAYIGAQSDTISSEESNSKYVYAPRMHTLYKGRQQEVGEHPTGSFFLQRYLFIPIYMNSLENPIVCD